MSLRSFVLAAVVATLSLVGVGLAVSAAHAAPYTTVYLWDSARRLAMKIEPDTGATHRVAMKYTYDADGELIETDKGSVTDEYGSGFAANPIETTKYAYDAVGNRIETYVLNGTAAPGLSLTQTTYDADDRPQCIAQRMNPAAFASLTATSGALPTSACSLGAAGSYGNDRITKTVYDAAGQTLQTIRAFADPLQQVYETFTYTLNGKAQTVTDAVGNETTYGYDGFDRLIETDFPSTTRGAGTSDATDRELYSYDANDNRTGLTKRDTRTLAWCYDALNREVGKYINRGVVNCASPPPMTGNEVATAYDLLNRRASALYPGGTGVVYGWDSASRLTGETTNGQAMAYSYDGASNRSQVTWPGAAGSATYAYDAMNRVTSITENGGATLATYDYTDAPGDLGRLTQITRGNASTRSFNWDNADRLTGLHEGFPNTSYNQDWTYSYNPASQDVSDTAGNDAYKWINHPAVSTSKTYDGLNRDNTITALLPPGTPCASATAYDCNGNLVNDGVNRAATYDVENRLTSVSSLSPAVTEIALTYDPLGRLRQTTAGSTVTTFLYDGDRLVAEYNGAGALLRRYVHGPGVDDPIVWYEGSTKYWLHADRQGSIIAWSGTTPTVPANQIMAYGPYGEPNSWGGERFAYTGQIQLGEAQLYHYKARAYDPATGRFMQTDPVGYSAGPNLYQYVEDDPADKTDPTGLDSCNGGHTSCPDGTNAAAQQQVAHDVQAAGHFVATHPGETMQVVGNAVSLIPTPPTEVGGRAVALAGTGVKMIEGGPATLKPGPFAGESTPATGPGRISGSQQAEVNRIGQETGCHTCGTTNPGTKSGNFVGDHQPPSALAKPGQSQSLYPHCLSCSRQQGGQVRQAVEAQRAAQGAIRPDEP